MLEKAQWIAKAAKARNKRIAKAAKARFRTLILEGAELGGFQPWPGQAEGEKGDRDP
jgi:hypothetical protein